MMKRILSLMLVGIMTISSFMISAPVQAATTSTKESLPEQVTTTLEIITKDSTGNLNLTKKVTRAQYARMLVNASAYKDKVGTTTSTSLYKDVKKTYWAAPYIKIAVDNGWMTGNIYGKFRPTSYITLQEAVNGIVVLLGYSNSDFNGNKAAAKMSFYTAEGLDDNISKTSKQTLTRKDCMNLFYNTLVADTKTKEVYAKTLGYAVDSNGDVDYLALINDKMKGPIIGMPGWRSNIPFSTASATFYRNGAVSSASALKKYDVLYYSKALRTVWAYNNKVTGAYTSALPNRLSPEQVTVAGQTYTIGTQDASYQLSTLGSYDIGDNISLLLGKDDTVVGVIDAGKVNTDVGGVVLEVGLRTNSSEDEDETLNYYIRIVDASGVEHDYDTGTTKYVKGNTVQITYVGGKTVVNKVTMDSVYGKVDETAEKLGTYKLASDVKILDMKDTTYTTVAKKRLANVNIHSGSVKYYKINTNNEITELILEDVTGDFYQYGILIQGIEAGGSGTYTIDINGTVKTEVTSGYVLGSTATNPARFGYTNGQLSTIMLLSRIDVSSVSSSVVSNGKTTYTMSDKVAVYLYDDGTYYATTLAKVSNLSTYNLKAYYDKSEALGGRVRVIVATIKK